MWTGRRPDSLHLYDFYSYWRDSVGNFTTIPQFFKDRGYETHSVGKVFHPGKSSNFTDDYPYSWSQRPFHPSTEKYEHSKVCKDKTTRRFQENLICPVNIKNQPEKILPDIQSLNYAIKVLRNIEKKVPFFLALGFHKPHIPLKFPKKYLARVSKKDVTAPLCPQMSPEMPLVSWHPWTDVRRRDDVRRLNISFPFGTMPHKWTIKIRHNYYAAAAYVDDLIGAVMDVVDKSNTIIVLTSDHGWSLGENGLWAKYSNFDVALKVPLIFNVPGLKGKTISNPVELVDLFPTLAGLTDLSDGIPNCNAAANKTSLCFEGKNLIPYMMNDNEETREKSYAISQYPRPSIYPRMNSDKPHLKQIKIMGYSIRTERYRYTEWVSFNTTSFTRNWEKNFGTELYDDVTDPEECRNLYFDARYLKIRVHLSNLLRLKVEEI